VASLTEKALIKGMHVKIASPDKDFKQLLCDKVQIMFPMVDLERWSFYTHKDYFRQHDSHPDIELGLREFL
jgi:5'-3' exonuclease